ncbi:MAG TPA: methyltransferase domain-containing protein [Blastocatellia bacterium]|nr:methyltransferase domain-containing protein [Blastocatellia bacterium]
MITKELPAEAHPINKRKAAPPLPISDWLNEFEQKRAREFQRRTGLEYQTLLKQILNDANLQPGRHVLEVAAGTGMIARHLVGLVGSEGKIIGVDSTKELIETARLDAQSAKVSTRIEWRVAPIKHLPFKEGTFDLVTCGLFNQFEPQGFFQETCRILRPEGVLVTAAELTAPAMLSDWVQKARRQYNRIFKNEPEEANAHYHSAHELTEMLRTAGFRQVVMRGLCGASGGRAFSLIRAVK